MIFPSITLLALPFLRPAERRVVLLVCGIIGAVLLATTVGRPAIDVYGLGFSPFAPVVLAIGGAVVARRAPRVAVVILVILIAQQLAIFRSWNLFDYVTDPLLTVILSCRAVARHPGGRRAQRAEPLVIPSAEERGRR